MQHPDGNQNEDQKVTTSRLVIKAVTSDMAGNYSCKISTLGGTVLSERVSLNVSK